MRAVLDTRVVVAADVAPLEGDLAVSAVTLAELHSGVLVAADAAVRAERLRRLTRLQRQFDPLPVDDDVAAGYGRLAAAVVAAGRGPRARSLDLLVAATALVHDARRYTQNAADLVGADDLVEVVSV